jgi:hypothetical protein
LWFVIVIFVFYDLILFLWSMCFLNGLFQICDGRKEIDIRNRKKDSDEDDQQFTVSWCSLRITMSPSDFDFILSAVVTDWCYLYYDYAHIHNVLGQTSAMCCMRK